MKSVIFVTLGVLMLQSVVNAQTTGYIINSPSMLGNPLHGNTYLQHYAQARGQDGEDWILLGHPSGVSNSYANPTHYPRGGIQFVFKGINNLQPKIYKGVIVGNETNNNNFLLIQFRVNSSSVQVYTGEQNQVHFVYVSDIKDPLATTGNPPSYRYIPWFKINNVAPQMNFVMCTANNIDNCASAVPRSPCNWKNIILGDEFRYVCYDDWIDNAIKKTKEFLYDDCGVYEGDGSTCAGCDNVPNSGLVNDACGVCGGDDSTCADDCGVPNGDNACVDCEGVVNGPARMVGRMCATSDAIRNVPTTNIEFSEDSPQTMNFDQMKTEMKKYKSMFVMSGKTDTQKKRIRKDRRNFLRDQRKEYIKQTRAGRKRFMPFSKKNLRDNADVDDVAYMAFKKNSTVCTERFEIREDGLNYIVPEYDSSCTSGQRIYIVCENATDDGTHVATLTGEDDDNLNTYNDPDGNSMTAYDQDLTISVTCNKRTFKLQLAGSLTAENGDCVSNAIIENGECVCDPNYTQDGNACTDQTSPTITVSGANPHYVEKDDEGYYTDAGATCDDAIDGSIGHRVEVGGQDVTLNTTGTYTISYDCKDTSDNEADQQTRVVHVVELATVNKDACKLDNSLTMDQIFDGTTVSSPDGSDVSLCEVRT